MYPSSFTSSALKRTQCRCWHATAMFIILQSNYASYLLDAPVHVNIELFAVVETDTVVGGVRVGWGRGRRGRGRQRHQRHAHVPRARAARVSDAVRSRVLRQGHQPVRAFARHELRLYIILPAGVRLHGHSLILSC